MEATLLIFNIVTRNGGTATEVLRIESAGNVGIGDGASAPDTRLNIYSPANMPTVTIGSVLDANGDWNGMLFGNSVYGGDFAMKAGILFERTTGE